MGDRWYFQQGIKQKSDMKQKRRLKKDIIADLNKLLGTEIKNIDRVTVDGLEQLIVAIERKLTE